MEKSKAPQKKKKNEMYKYIMVVPLVLLAGWLLQRSYLFASGNDNDHQEIAMQQHDQLVALEKQKKAEERLRDDNGLNLNINIDGKNISIESLADLEKLGEGFEKMGEDFEKMGEDFEKMGEEFEKSFKQVFLKELNEKLKDWKKNDYPELKKDLKKLKIELRKEIKDKLAKELRDAGNKENLDKLERELVKNIKDMVNDLEISVD